MADEPTGPTRLRRTPLYDEHRSLGAKMIDFAGFEMPVQYTTGIHEEHHAVRQRAGLFDVSHMGELEIRGGDPVGLLQLVTVNDVSRLDVGQAHYTLLCQEDGGVLDDCLLFRLPDHYLLVTNASNRERDRDWVRKFADRFRTEVVDRSDDIALLALQGPAAEEILGRVTTADLPQIGYYHVIQNHVAGAEALISRTGYTGEDGFELYLAAGDALDVWRELLSVGDGDGLVPAGLGARDSLRLEVGYLLYGNDVDDLHTGYEAGVGWAIKLDKGDFLGSSALRRQKEEGVRERLVGFTLRERGFPRQGYEVRYNGEPAGEVTSGTWSPTLDQGIGLAYVPTEAAKPGTTIDVVVRDRPVPAEVVRPPFYRNGSIHRP